MGENNKNKFCGKCGSIIPNENEKYCGNCGAELNYKTEQSPSIVGTYIAELRAQGKVMSTSSAIYDKYYSRSSKYSGENLGVFVFLGVLYGSITFWIAGFLFIESGRFIPTYGVFIALFIVFCILIGVIGSVDLRGPRNIRFIISTIVTVIAWFIIIFVGLFLLYM